MSVLDELEKRRHGDALAAAALASTRAGAPADVVVATLLGDLLDQRVALCAELARFRERYGEPVHAGSVRR